MKIEYHELLLQALETEIGGVSVYETAIECAVDEHLKEEWQKYHAQTLEHVEILNELFETLGLDTEARSPGRDIVKTKGQALVVAMKAARAAGDPLAAQLVAAECVVDAETKDHLNWELIGQVAKSLKGDDADALKEAYDAVEDEEDEHLYHTMGWTRELWIQALGLPAVLPPPEEEKDVKTAIGAARAKQSRKEMLKH